MGLKRGPAAGPGAGASKESQDTVNPEQPGKQSCSEPDDDKDGDLLPEEAEAPVVRKRRTAAAKGKNANGAVKAGTDDEKDGDFLPEDTEAPVVKKRKTAAAKGKNANGAAKARAGRKPKEAITTAAPALPSQIDIAATAQLNEFRANLDLSLAHRQARAEEARAVACEAMTALASRAMGYIDLLTFSLQTKLEQSGFLATGQTLDSWTPTDAPKAPPLPAPYQSLWLAGSASKGPLAGGGTGDDGGGQTVEMLDGEPVAPDADDDNED